MSPSSPMPSIAAPIWLIGLALVPLIWWLHRLGDPDAATPVSAAFLFYTRDEVKKTSHTLPRADPLWILRATLFSLLVLALARLNLPRDPERDITVWFDDSISMQTNEDGRSRTVIAATRLATALDDAGPAKVRIRLLSDHRKQFDVAALAAGPLSAAIDDWLGLNGPGIPQIPFTPPRETERAGWVMWRKVRILPRAGG